jgi:hypothetical protein
MLTVGCRLIWHHKACRRAAAGGTRNSGAETKIRDRCQKPSAPPRRAARAAIRRSPCGSSTCAGMAATTLRPRCAALSLVNPQALQARGRRLSARIVDTDPTPKYRHPISVLLVHFVIAVATQTRSSIAIVIDNRFRVSRTIQHLSGCQVLTVDQ